MSEAQAELSLDPPLELERCPTPVALVARRLSVSGSDASAETFLLASYLAEATIKAIGCFLIGGAPRASA